MLEVGSSEPAGSFLETPGICFSFVLWFQHLQLLASTSRSEVLLKPQWQWLHFSHQKGNQKGEMTERPKGRGVLTKIRWCAEISHRKNGEAKLSRVLRGHKSHVWELRAEGKAGKLEEVGPGEWACRRVGLPCLPLKCRLSVPFPLTSHS